MKVCCVFSCVIFVIFLNISNGQVPPRLNIPGAVLVSQSRPSGFRQARIQSDSSPLPRPRRPIIHNALPASIREVKPVVEELEDPPQQQQPQGSFDDEVTKLGINALQSAVRQAASEEAEEPTRQPLAFRPERPIPVLRENVRDKIEQIQIARPAPVLRQEVPQGRQLPAFRQETVARPISRHEDVPVRQRQPIQQVQQVRQQPAPQPPPQVFRQPARAQAPAPRQHNHYDGEEPGRTRKPVVQILRKYRTDNPDGSITWGYENEDGSFKEEIMGVDCITRGKYGYVDPDGVRREYSYETGNKCDEPYEDEELITQGKPLPLPHGRKPQPQPQFRPQPAQY